MLSAKCPNTKCDDFLKLLVKDPPRECSKCGHDISNEYIEQYKEVMDLTKEKLDEMKNVNCKYLCFERCKKFLRTLSK